MNTSKRVKVHFTLSPDEDGYPPTDSEFLWCIPTEHRTYIVDNIPFFVRDISLGDEISARRTGKILQFSRLERKSRNTTIRILIKKPNVLEIIRERIESLGGGAEFMEDLSLLAVTMPPESSIVGALTFLDEQAEQGNVGIEESAVRYQNQQ